MVANRSVEKQKKARKGKERNHPTDKQIPANPQNSQKLTFPKLFLFVLSAERTVAANGCTLCTYSHCATGGTFRVISKVHMSRAYGWGWGRSVAHTVFSAGRTSSSPSSPHRFRGPEPRLGPKCVFPWSLLIVCRCAWSQLQSYRRCT